MKYIVALDQGTTSSRAVVFDGLGRMVASHNIEFAQIYPHPGWVEHRPQDILDSQVTALKLAVDKAGIEASTSKRWASPTSGRPPCCGIGAPASRFATPSSGSAAAPRRWWSG